MLELRGIYENVRIKARNAKAPALLYAKADPLIEHITRSRPALTKVVVNSHNVENALKEKFNGEFAVEYMAEPFAEYGLEDALSDALQKRSPSEAAAGFILKKPKPVSPLMWTAAMTNPTVRLPGLIRKRPPKLPGRFGCAICPENCYRFCRFIGIQVLKPVIEELENALADDPYHAHVLGLSRGGNVESSVCAVGRPFRIF